MVVKLGLAMGYDFEADGGTVSLLDYTDGFDVAYQGWAPKSSPDRDGMVTETITLRARGTSIDDLATRLQSIAALSWEAQRYTESAVGTAGVWLRVQIDGETKVRQSWVRELRHGMESSVYDATFRNQFHANEYEIAIRRNPWWEGTDPGSVVIMGTVNSLGGTCGYSNVGGDLAARMGNIILPLRGAGTIAMRDVWMGIRSNRYAAATAFMPWWGIGTAFGGAGTAIADTLARSGTAWQYTQTNSAQIFFGGQNVSGGAYPNQSTDQRGQFMVLMRARIAGGTATMQMQSAWQGDGVASGTASAWGNAQTYPRVYLDSAAGTAYMFYEMGVVDIPISRAFSVLSNDIIPFQMLILNSQLISGTVTMGVDGLYLIPRDEGYVRMKYSGNSPQFTGLAPQAWISEGPDGEKTSAFVSTQGPFAVSSLTMTGGVPPGDGIIVLCGQTLTESSSTYGFPGLYVYYYEKWKELRGSDGI